MKAGRILARALVVIGGAAAVSAIAWLTATASASTVTQVTDGPTRPGIPAVATSTGDPQPSVLSPVIGSVPVARHADDAMTPALARVRELPGAHTGRLADVLETSVTYAVPVAVKRIGVAATNLTGLTGLAALADGPRDHVEISPAGPDLAGPNDLTRAPENTGLRQGTAGLSSAAIPVHPATTAIPHAAPRSDHGVGGHAGRSWLPSCVVPASAGSAAGHENSCGDVVQPPAAEHPQLPHRRNGVLCPAETSAEIQPGVTPD